MAVIDKDMFLTNSSDPNPELNIGHGAINFFKCNRLNATLDDIARREAVLEFFSEVPDEGDIYEMLMSLESDDNYQDSAFVPAGVYEFECLEQMQNYVDVQANILTSFFFACVQKILNSTESDT